MRRYDVIVIGAGPGGCSTAFFLKHFSKDRLDVLLLERLDDARYLKYHRMCGEGISKRAFRDIAPIEPTGVTHHIHRIFQHWPGNKVTEAKVEGYIIDRAKFLRSIMEKFEKMGGHIRQERATSVVSTENGFSIRCYSGEEYQSNYLVGADGAYSLVRKEIFGLCPPTKIVFDQYIVDQQTEKDTLHFLYDENYKGSYSWIFPSVEGSRIGFPFGTKAIPEDARERHRRPIVFGKLDTIVKGNACIVGDAACQINPLTLGGIRASLVAGKMAAKAISKADPLSYQRHWRRSRLSSKTFIETYLILRDMTNEDLIRLLGGVEHQMTTSRAIIQYIRNKNYRRVFWGFLFSLRNGW